MHAGVTAVVSMHARHYEYYKTRELDNVSIICAYKISNHESSQVDERLTILDIAIAQETLTHVYSQTSAIIVW